MKRICAILALIVLLAGCGSSAADPAPTATPEPMKQEPKTVYFGSDEVVDAFLTAYNATAEIKIPPEEVEKGNIKTKALVYMEDLSFEIIHAPEFLSVSVGVDPENEETKLRAVFGDVIAAARPEISGEDADAAWEEMHATGYLVEGFALGDMTITYVPTKARIDMKIPLK